MRPTSDEHPETSALIALAQEGDHDALAIVLGRYRERIHALVRRKLGGPLRLNLDSSDVVQSVCLEAIQGIQRVEYRDEEGFIRWLARITENTIRDKHRYFAAQKRRPGEFVEGETHRVSLAEGAALTPSGELSNVEQMTLVLEAIQRLPAEYRRVIELVRFEKMSHSEAAAELKKSEKATRMLLARARIKLLQEMKRGLEPDD